MRLPRFRVGLLRNLLAQDCMLCAAPSGSAMFDASCAGDLPALGDACPRCAGPSPGGAVCGACLRDPPSFDATVAAWRDEFPVDGLVMALKYGGRLALAGACGDALAIRCRRLTCRTTRALRTSAAHSAAPAPSPQCPSRSSTTS